MKWKVAFGCVAAVLLTGEYQAWRQVSPIESLWSTGYGMALCAKVFLVTLMAALAYLGRRRLTPERLREFFGDDIDVVLFSPPCKAATNRNLCSGLARA